MKKSTKKVQPLSAKQSKIANFDVNGLGQKEMGIFGLPFDLEESNIALIPVPWEVTVSYSSGTAKGPEQIREASYQVDLCNLDNKDFWKEGIFIEKVPKHLQVLGKQLRAKAEAYIEALEAGHNPETSKKLMKEQQTIEKGCQKMNAWVEDKATELLTDNKIVGLIGGDHSTPLGFIKALSHVHNEFGILQIDAHADLRKAYEGFKYSHASIMYNCLEISEVKKLVQVGIRDFCQFELDLIQNSDKRICTYFDAQLQEAKFKGMSWASQCDQIISKLPHKVYISFDIDGLDPSLCPNTGTPVAGGLSFFEAIFLLKKVQEAGKQIIGFDIVEVANGHNDWDANVGARLLYNLCQISFASNHQKPNNVHG